MWEAVLVAAHAALIVATAAPGELVVLRRFPAPAARQGVAVAGEVFYAIDDRTIEKYDATSGKRLLRADVDAVHLNGGVVHDGILYCAHSNYPALPRESSVEWFDAATLRHLGSHRFEPSPGSAAWIDRFEGRWFVAFAHYDGRGGEPGKGSADTTLAELDDAWRITKSYRYPADLVRRFARPGPAAATWVRIRRSNSGGAFGRDGALYLTGHEAHEVYVTSLDRGASELRWVATLAAPFEGQGIAWHAARGTLWGIERSTRTVVEASPIVRRARP